MVLVDLRVERRDLALPERVVQRVVDLRDGDAVARGGVAVDHQRELQARGLLVRHDVLDLGELAQRRRDLRCPLVELGEVGILEDVLVLRARCGG